MACRRNCLCSGKRGIFLSITSTCVVLFVILSKNHWINETFRASYKEKQTAGQPLARKVDLSSVANNAEQVTPANEDNNNASDTHVSNAQTNQVQIVPSTEEQKVEHLKALEKILDVHNNPGHAEPCLSQADYERQLTPDKEREKRLAGWANAAPSVYPILPDMHWKLCEPRKHTFNYRISQADFCAKHKPTTIFLVLSSPYTSTRRNNSRTKWAKWTTYRNHTIACVFLFGQLAGEDQESLLVKQKMLNEENQRYGDIVQADFVDSYANLTYKTLMGLDWVLRFCPQAKYVFKLDDDVTEGLQTRFVNFVQSYSNRSSSAIWCLGNRKAITNDAVRDPESKWGVSYTQYPEQRYPVYCPGGAPGGYGMETSTAEVLLTNAYDTRFFQMEDVYITGILRRRLRNLRNITLYRA